MSPVVGRREREIRKGKHKNENQNDKKGIKLASKRAAQENKQIAKKEKRFCKGKGWQSIKVIK